MNKRETELEKRVVELETKNNRLNEIIHDYTEREKFNLKMYQDEIRALGLEVDAITGSENTEKIKEEIISIRERTRVNFYDFIGATFEQHMLKKWRWIPIYEKLPTDDEVYFVLTEDGYGYGTYDPKIKKWYLDFDAVGKEVTHWMITPPDLAITKKGKK